MGFYAEAKSATDCHGRKIKVGDMAVFSASLDDSFRLPVRVIGIHKQGADGTILTFDGPPKTEYPHHNSARASQCRRVSA